MTWWFGPIRSSLVSRATLGNSFRGKQRKDYYHRRVDGENANNETTSPDQYRRLRASAKGNDVPCAALRAPNIFLPLYARLLAHDDVLERRIAIFIIEVLCNIYQPLCV